MPRSWQAQNVDLACSGRLGRPERVALDVVRARGRGDADTAHVIQKPWHVHRDIQDAILVDNQNAKVYN